MKRGGHKFLLAIALFMASIMTASLFVAPVVNAEPSDSSTTTEQTDGSSDKEDKEESCEESMSGFGWIFCPGQNLITDLIDGIVGWIADSMEWTILAGDSSDEIKDIWQKFLNLANIVFAIMFMVMIYSMATSQGLSNYSIKKILPRLIIVAIVVNISFYVCAALVDISNIAGKGVYDLIYQQADGANNDFLGYLGSSLASTALLVLAVFLFGGSVIIALAICLVALAFRQLALVLLVIVSPVAFALYLLPNTEKWGKKWLDWFARLLFVYPMFTAVWASSRLVSNIFANTGTSGIPSFLMDFFCAIAPAIAILPIFKASGGLMGSIVGKAQGMDGVKKAKKAINGAERGLVTNSNMAANARKWGSGQAYKLQNKLGNKPVIGSLFTGQGFNKAVNYAATDEAAREKAAMDASTSWLKSSGLSGGQILEAFQNAGTYTDASGRKTTITDTHKLQAIAARAKDLADPKDWDVAIPNIQAKIADLEKHGRKIDARNLRNAYADAMESKSVGMTNGGIGKFRDGKLTTAADLNTERWKYLGSLSNEKRADISGANQSYYQKQLANADTTSMSTAERQEYRKAAANTINTANAILNDSKLMSKVNSSGKAALEQSRDYTRTIEEQDFVVSHSVRSVDGTDKNIDQIMRDYNSEDATKVSGAIADARTVYYDKDIFDNLKPEEQFHIQNVASKQPGDEYIPTPVAIWAKEA